MKRHYLSILGASLALAIPAISIPVSSSILPTAAIAEAAPQEETAADNLTNTQRNSINMLNWIIYLTQEVNSSNNNRLFIEEIYDMIVNNTYPNAVDSHTKDRLNGLLEALNRYRMVDVKRERIQYLYEQSKAEALRELIPDARTMIRLAKMISQPQALAVAVVSTAINSINSYTSATAKAELNYLKDGWELDDAASEVFYNLRADTFSYMIDIVRDYDLPGYMSLTEDAVEQFVSWKNNDNVVRRIQFLESTVETYRAFGNYWLLLAQSYYENGDYSKCLDAVHSYESITTQIFRCDSEYAKILPFAIVAAQETMSEADYIATASAYAEAILKNIGTDDWSLRYYVALTYSDLYTRTSDSSYLKKAYDCALDNVNYLVDEQITLNATYLADVQEASTPKGATKDTQNQIKSYNKMLKETRKTELPPVYQPLLLNCDLLFAVADEMNISETEQQRIDKMLHPNGEPLLLVRTLDDQYRYTSTAEDIAVEEVNFYGETLTIPAWLVSADASVSVEIINQAGDQISTYTDWRVNSVSRKTKGDVSTFVAEYKCEAAGKFSYDEGTTVKVTIIPSTIIETNPILLTFTASQTKTAWYEHVQFWNADYTFQRSN